jgi:predicted CXXCH cytochrome family protein
MIKNILLLFILFFCNPAYAENNSAAAPPNPSSAKECALCHYRWIDTFFIDGRGSDLVPYQFEKVVANAEICFSCHDGSVADSRDRVFNDHRHPINVPPPPGMKIPEIYPLDKNGFMQCATCHTAHGVPSEMGIEKTIFIRTTNENSFMCRQCHSDKLGGPEAGNHPVDTTALVISPELLKMGAVTGTEKNMVVCESCHNVHGAANDKFLVDSADGTSHLCLDCHQDKAWLVDSKHDLRKTAPTSKNLKGMTPEKSGVCGTCHLVHGGSNQILWGREMVEADKRLKPSDFCTSCHREGGAGTKKQLVGHSHPLNISLVDKGMSPKLPLYDLRSGKAVPLERGVLTCPTCHEPHFGKKLMSNGQKRENFLRLPNKPSPELCRQCHPQEALVEKTAHDLLGTNKDSINIQGETPSESGTCGVCHLIHGADSPGLWAMDIRENKRTPPSEMVCVSCHRQRGVAHEKLVGKNSHPVNISPARRKIQTTLPLYAKEEIERLENGLLTCMTCHNPHQWDPLEDSIRKSTTKEGNAGNSFLRLSASPSPVLCADCHRTKGFIEKTEHDMVVMAPESKNIKGQSPLESGPCGACHIIHNSKNRVRLWARKFGRGKGVMDKMCKSCHKPGGLAEKKVPTVDSHPEGMLITNVGRNTKGKANYFPLFSNRNGKNITVGDIACASCHDVHWWDPKYSKIGSGMNEEGMANNSFLRMQTYTLMCIDCHGLDALFRFKYYHNKKQRGPVPPQ